MLSFIISLSCNFKRISFLNAFLFKYLLLILSRNEKFLNSIYSCSFSTLFKKLFSPTSVLCWRKNYFLQHLYPKTILDFKDILCFVIYLLNCSEKLFFFSEAFQFPQLFFVPSKISVLIAFLCIRSHSLF